MLLYLRARRDPKQTQLRIDFVRALCGIFSEAPVDTF